jgi:acyl CoA:acetate/3-ketoacid CoA transferase alpha subunit
VSEAATTAPGASKVVSMRDALERYVHDGDRVVIEGFTHLNCFSAGH